jgi:hypothetical protein
MVETRRSDEPLVETVDPDALARRHGGRAAGAVPERGRKQAARSRSPERFGETEARNPSYLEEILAKNGSTFTALLMVTWCSVARHRCLQSDSFLAGHWLLHAHLSAVHAGASQRVRIRCSCLVLHWPGDHFAISP